MVKMVKSIKKSEWKSMGQNGPRVPEGLNCNILLYHEHRIEKATRNCEPLIIIYFLI